MALKKIVLLFLYRYAIKTDVTFFWGFKAVKLFLTNEISCNKFNIDSELLAV